MLISAEEHVLLRIYLTESDRHQHRPLYEILLETLHSAGFSGATALRGISGFGAHRMIHSQKLIDISAGLPIIVEAAGSKREIEAIVPRLEALMEGGMITQHPVSVRLPGRK